MITIICLILSFASKAKSGQLVDNPEGPGQFITGRGCGVTTPIKHLNYIPENLDDFQCSFVNVQETSYPPAKVACHKTDPKVQVRFGGSSNHNEGYVEVNYSNQGWKGVCDDNFDLNDAHVLCRMAGFADGASAFYVKSSPFGYGSSGHDFVVDGLQCTGSELTIADCQRNDWNKEDCKISEWAGVQCSGEKTQACG